MLVRICLHCAAHAAHLGRQHGESALCSVRSTAQRSACSTARHTQHAQRTHAVLSTVGPSMRLHFQTADSIVSWPYGHDSVPVEPSPIVMVLP